jgi:acyl carrier protein
VTDEEKVKTAIASLLAREGREVPAERLGASAHLKDDLGLDSANLIELTVLVHTMYGVDLGRRAAERKILPTTIRDLAALLGAAP